MDPTTPSPPTSSSVAAVIVAAGSGTRFGGAKQYSELRGRRVLDWSIAAARSVCGWVVLVVPPGLADRRRARRRRGGGRWDARARRRCAPAWRRCPTTPRSSWSTTRRGPSPRPSLFASVVAEVRAGAGAAVPGVEVVDTLRLRRRRQPRRGTRGPRRRPDPAGLRRGAAASGPRRRAGGHRRRLLGRPGGWARGGGAGRSREPQDHHPARPDRRRRAGRRVGSVRRGRDR